MGWEGDFDPTIFSIKRYEAHRCFHLSFNAYTPQLLPPLLGVSFGNSVRIEEERLHQRG
jgi:hypothetical protein